VAHQSNYPHSSAKRVTLVSQAGARDGRDATGSGSDDRRSPGAPWIGDRTRSPDAPEGPDSGARLSGPCAGSRRATLSWGIDCQTPERASQPAPPCRARTGAHRPGPQVAGRSTLCHRRSKPPANLPSAHLTMTPMPFSSHLSGGGCIRAVREVNYPGRLVSTESNSIRSIARKNTHGIRRLRAKLQALSGAARDKCG
jgi:hypothetical protein